MEENEEIKNELFDISDIDANRYSASPAITSFTLVSNWNKTVEDAMKNAVDKLIRINPILTGRLIKDRNNNKLQVLSLQHSSFFNVIKGPDNVLIPDDVYGRIHIIHTQVEPLFDVLGLAIEQITTGSKLFDVTVCTLPNLHACYLIQLSHMIADGASYYMLLKQFQALLNDEEIETLPKLRWVPSPKNVLTPRFYSEKDANRELKSWRPAFLNLALTQSQRNSWVHILDTEKMSSYKPGLVLAAARAQMTVKFLSANDLITAALAEVFDTELMEMMANMRGRLDGVSMDMAANGERGIFFPRKLAASNPEYVRSTPLKHFCAWKDSNHMSSYDYAFVASDFSVITNWCSLTNFVVPKTTKLLVHTPASAFVKAMPINFCIVFKADDSGTIAICHNMKIETSNYKKRFENSIIFKNIIDHEKEIIPESVQSHWIHVKRWVDSMRVINRWRSLAWGINHDSLRDDQ